MALLSAEEREEVKRRTGNYVKEKCDCCHKPIFDPFSYIVKGQVLCSLCKTGHKFVVEDKKQKKEEETVEMKTKKEAPKKAAKKEEPEVESKKIAGHLIPGTAIADLYQYLEDEKKHPIKDVLKAIARHKADKMGRLRQLARYGRQLGGWAVIIDTESGIVQLKLGAAAAKAAEKATNSKPKAKVEEPEEEEVTPKKKAKGKADADADDEKPAKKGNKQLEMIQKLVRRTLKAGGEWTRSKVIEKLSDENDLEPKDVQEAVNTEIKLGGITVKGGLLQLE